ncbi:MAG: hypothetical protein Q9174_005732 [Haloplaca sp. 1 TL-2023]
MSMSVLGLVRGIAISLLAGSIKALAVDVDPSSSNPGSVLALNPQLNGSDPQVQCLGGVFGYDIDLDSCRGAQELIPMDDKELTFGQRGRMGSDVVTPARWSSTDGKCVIDLPETESQMVKASYQDLALAAEEMIEICMEYKEKTEGSLATNIGRDGKLALQMKSYSPTVKCSEDLLVAHRAYMEEILRKMPASQLNVKYGRRGVPRVRVRLPLTYVPQSSHLGYKLQVMVDVAAATTVVTTTSYDIWAAAVAIGAMCVRKGKGGSAAIGKKISSDTTNLLHTHVLSYRK